jgi:hypothetical protein
LSSTNPVPVNVAALQTDIAFLGSQNVAAGTYNSLAVTFANPQLTIFNASDSSLSSVCAVGKVCEVTPTTTSGSSLALTFCAPGFTGNPCPSNSLTSSALPVTLSASSPLAFKLDVHLDTVIQSDLSLDLTATNGVTISQVTPPTPGGPIPAFAKIFTGTVQTLGTNQFTLQTLEGRTFTIDVNNSTTYSDFPSSGTCTTTAEGFSCVATGDVVNVEVTLQTDGSLLATAVDFIQLPTQQTVEGNIIGLSTSGSNTIMDLVIQKQPSSANADVLPVGKHASVTVPASLPAGSYTVDSGSFVLPTYPPALTFTSAANLQVGQTVLVVVEGTVTHPAGSGSGNPNGSAPFGAADVSFTASMISLEPSEITGTVASVPAQGSLSFTLATMPAFFVPPSATAGKPPAMEPVIITIDTTGSTTFLPSTLSPDSILGLKVNDVVSVQGWVFSTPTSTTTITIGAESVLDRGQVSPLF